MILGGCDHSNSSAMSLFDRAHRLCSLDSMWLRYTVFDTQWVICRNLPMFPTHVYLSSPLAVIPLEFYQDLWQQKLESNTLPFGVVCLTIRLAVFYWTQTDRHRAGAYTALAYRRAAKNRATWRWPHIVCHRRNLSCVGNTRLVCTVGCIKFQMLSFTCSKDRFWVTARV